MRTALRTLLAAGVLVCAAAAPAAAADALAYDCGFDAHHQEAATGPEHQGYAFGFVVGDADDEVSIVCEVRVNHIPVAATPEGSGTAAAVTAGPVSFEAEDGDVVELCALVTLNGTPTDHCQTVVWGPPEDWSAFDPLLAVVIELVAESLWWLPPTLCPLLPLIAGSYGPLVINAQGDVFVAGEPQWDCPPYDIWPAG